MTNTEIARFRAIVKDHQREYIKHLITDPKATPDAYIMAFLATDYRYMTEVWGWKPDRVNAFIASVRVEIRPDLYGHN